MRLVCFVVGLAWLSSPLDSSLANNEYPALLGNGYDSLKLEHKMNQCVEGTEIEMPNAEISVDFNKVENWSNLLTQMNFKVPGSIVLGSDSELAKFVLKARDTHITSTYILQHYVAIKQKFIKNPRITQLDLMKENSVRFREDCGTQYISMTTSGGKLYVGAKFSFSDFEFKQEFDGGGAVHSITGLAAHVDSLSEIAKKSSSVEIFFHQVGGNLSDLNSMFQSGDIIKCSLDHFDRCESLLEAIFKYSQDSFTKSITEGKDQTISFQTEKYPNVPRVYENPNVRKEREKLLNILDQQQYDRDTLNSVRSLKGERLKEYAPSDDRSLQRLLYDVHSNMGIIRDAIRLSFENPDLFLAEYALEKLELSKITMPVKKFGFYKDMYANLSSNMPSITTSLLMAATAGMGYFLKYALLAQGKVPESHALKPLG